MTANVGPIDRALRALIGVYGPLLMTLQYQRVWGVVIVTNFALVWLPFYFAAVATDSVLLLVAANVAYDVVHLSVLTTIIHRYAIPAVRAGTASFDGPPPTGSKDAKGAVQEA